MYFLISSIVLLRQLWRLYASSFIFQVPPVYNYSTCYTSRVFTRLIHQVYIYAFSAPTTRLHVQCTPKALTNQGEVRQYINHIAYLNKTDSYHHPNEHTILYIFRAPGYNSPVPLNWYKQPYNYLTFQVWLARFYYPSPGYLLPILVKATYYIYLIWFYYYPIFYI